MNMNCSNCPDREICYKSGNNTENPRDAKYREAYMSRLHPSKIKLERGI